MFLSFYIRNGATFKIKNQVTIWSALISWDWIQILVSQISRACVLRLIIIFMITMITIITTCSTAQGYDDCCRHCCFSLECKRTKSSRLKEKNKAMWAEGWFNCVTFNVLCFSVQKKNCVHCVQNSLGIDHSKNGTLYMYTVSRGAGVAHWWEHLPPMRLSCYRSRIWS